MRSTVNGAWGRDSALRAAAARVLAGNDAGGWTRAAPWQYPHQWSWDSAFIAIGWAHLDLSRAMREQQRLFDAQWASGKIPHIVYGEGVAAGAYFPDGDRWNCAVSPEAPTGLPHTSGLCQPPVHAIALARIWDLAIQADPALRGRTAAYLRRVYPIVLGWHRYLATHRDPGGTGLVSIYHPWEDADNSPRWDSVLARLRTGHIPPYVRRDTRIVTDAAQRPSNHDYDRYLWLVELLKDRRYDEVSIHHDYPFLVQDVFFSAVLVAANEALLELSRVVGAGQADHELISGWVRRGRHALASCWDPATRLCLDYDQRAGAPLRHRTFAGLAPLMVAGLPSPIRDALLAELDSAAFLGDPALRWPLVPSTSRVDPAFEPRNYWRGPIWPVINWLLWRGLIRAGQPDRAERLRAASLEQITAGGFAEYFDPLTGAALGSPDQSWTAAVALDWLAYDPAAAAGPARDR